MSFSLDGVFQTIITISNLYLGGVKRQNLDPFGP